MNRSKKHSFAFILVMIGLLSVPLVLQYSGSGVQASKLVLKVDKLKTYKAATAFVTIGGAQEKTSEVVTTPSTSSLQNVDQALGLDLSLGQNL